MGVDGFKKIHQASGNDGLQKVIDVIELEKQGRIKNVDDWISFFKRSNAEDTNLADVIGELSAAKQTTLELRQGEVINVGGDERSLAQNRDPEKSFDLTVENQQTGEVLRNIEVETVRDTVYEAGELESGVGHAASKAVKNTSGTVEAAIRIDLPEPGSRKIDRETGKVKYFGSNGRYVEIYEPDNPALDPNHPDFDPDNPELERIGMTDRIGRDTYAGEKSIFKGLELSLSRSRDPRLNRVDRVTIFDKNGTTIAILRKQMGGTWKLENMR